MRKSWFPLLLLSLSIPACAQPYEDAFRQRAEHIIHYAADRYELPRPNYSDPEKVYWPVVTARLHKYGLSDPLANALLDSSVFKQKLPFHFILVGMARIMPGYPDAPAMKKNRLLYLRNVAARTDSYNPWTSEGTENHTNMARTSGYIYAEQMKDYPEEFPGMEEKRRAMKNWIQYFVTRSYATGTGEFNASTYGIYNIIGYLNLFDFARDPGVRSLAKAMLDYYACELAIHHYRGMTSGAESRGAPSDRSLDHETEWLSWLWFGDVSPTRLSELFPNARDKAPLQAVHAATSTYRPDKAIRELAKMKNRVEEWYINLKPSYLLSTPGYIPQYLYNHPSFSLGSASYPYGAFGSSAYKNTTWKLISRTGQEKADPQMLTGGGMYYGDRKGMIRDPYLQNTQYRNTLIMLYKLPLNYREIHEQLRDTFRLWKIRWEEDFARRFSAEDEKITSVGNPVKFQDVKDPGSIPNACYIRLPEDYRDTIINNVLFVELDYTYLMIRSVNQLNPLTPQHSLITDEGPAGQLTGLILEVHPREGNRDLNRFILEYLRNTELQVQDHVNRVVYKDMKGNEIQVDYREEGSFTEPIYDWGYGPVKQSYIQTSPPYVQPDWPEGKGFGRIPEVEVNGKDYPGKKRSSVYQSDNLVIDGKGIRINTGRSKLKTRLPKVKTEGHE